VLTTDHGATGTEKAVEPDVLTGTPPSPEALIEEARQRARRRRLWTLVAVVTVIVGVVAGLAITGGSGGPRPRAMTSTKPRAKHAPSPVKKKTISPATSSFCGANGQMQFVNASDGWLLNGAGAILATTDQGRHWTAAYEGPDCVSSVDLLNSSDGWALTVLATLPGAPEASPTVLRTTNGGRTWVTITGPREDAFRSIDMVTPTTGGRSPAQAA
jgi:hypothetical protein